MPQEIRVLKCCECAMYQVDIVKVAKKWQCKICGVKQTPRTEYYRGSGVECRLKAQELNMGTGKQRQLQENVALKLLANEENDDHEHDFVALSQLEQEKEQLTSLKFEPSLSTPTKSKWSSYVEKSTESTNGNQKEMFNFRSTQRWSQSTEISSSSSTSVLKRICTDTKNQQTHTKKKCSSKWDDFV